MITDKEKEEIKVWYSQFCYKHKLAEDIYDIEHMINSSLTKHENINKIEEDLNKLVETDVKLNENIKEKVKLRQDEMKLEKERKTIEDYKEIAKNELELIKRICFKSTHIVILGKRREGKTSLGFEILRWHKEMNNKEILIYRFPKPEILPRWIRNINNVREIGCNQVILIDEASNDLDQYSYQKQSNRFLSQLLKRAGQTNTSFIFVDHNSGFLNKNMLRMIDIWILKKNTEFAVEDERKFVRALYSRMLWEPKINEYFVHSEGYEGILKFSTPEFFTEELSTGFDIGNRQVIDMNELINLVKPKPIKNINFK